MGDYWLADLTDLQTILPGQGALWMKLPGSFCAIKRGTKTAHQWRFFMELFAPLIFPALAQHSHKNRLNIIDPGVMEAILQLSTIIRLLLRPSISQKQVHEAKMIIASFQKRLLQLRPGLRYTRNLHQLAHILGDIEAHRPVYCMWCFHGERFGQEVKYFNTNGKQVELGALNAQMKAAWVAWLSHQLQSFARSEEEDQLACKLATLRASLRSIDGGLDEAASNIYDDFQDNITHLGELPTTPSVGR
jgi:hypothetical protein